VVVVGEMVGEVSLARARQRARRDLEALPEDLRAVDRIADPYPVRVDRGIEELLERGRAFVHSAEPDQELRK